MLNKFINNLTHLVLSEEGATAVKYAILTSLIAAVIAGAVSIFGTAVFGLFDSALAGW